MIDKLKEICGHNLGDGNCFMLQQKDRPWSPLNFISHCRKIRCNEINCPFVKFYTKEIKDELIRKFIEGK